MQCNYNKYIRYETTDYKNRRKRRKNILLESLGLLLSVIILTQNVSDKILVGIHNPTDCNILKLKDMQ